MENSIAVFDIDGTLRRVVDPWMMLHDHVGTEELGAKFYSKWLIGKISYRTMTRLGAMTWKGQTKANLLSCLESNPIRAGAHELVDWFKDRGIPCVGISTGLSFLNEVSKTELGLDAIVSNEIVFDNEICTGKVNINVTEESKGQLLAEIMVKYGIDRVVSFGDGPGDIAMFEKSVFSVAVFPRSDRVKEAATVAIESEPINQVIEWLQRNL